MKYLRNVELCCSSRRAVQHLPSVEDSCTFSLPFTWTQTFFPCHCAYVEVQALDIWLCQAPRDNSAVNGAIKINKLNWKSKPVKGLQSTRQLGSCVQTDAVACGCMCIGTKIWCMCSTLHICKRAHRLEYQSGTFCSFIVAQLSGFPSWFCVIRRVTCWQTCHRRHVHWCHLKISPKNSEIYRTRSTLSIGNCGCIFFHDQHNQTPKKTAAHDR